MSAAGYVTRTPCRDNGNGAHFHRLCIIFLIGQALLSAEPVPCVKNGGAVLGGCKNFSAW
jgi:hypothetical protein